MQVYALHRGSLSSGICSKAGCQSSQGNGLLKDRSLNNTANRAHNDHRRTERGGKADDLVQVLSATQKQGLHLHKSKDTCKGDTVPL